MEIRYEETSTLTLGDLNPGDVFVLKSEAEGSEELGPWLKLVTDEPESDSTRRLTVYLDAGTAVEFLRTAHVVKVDGYFKVAR